MKSGLGDRNNPSNQPELDLWGLPVSMKSGLRDRNNERRNPASAALAASQ